MRSSLQSAPTLVFGGGPMGLPLCLGGSAGPIPDASHQLQELNAKSEHPRSRTGWVGGGGGAISRRRRHERRTRRAISTLRKWRCAHPIFPHPAG